MNFMLIPVMTKEQLQLFGNYYVLCIKYHQQYANQLGLQDQVVEHYTFEQAISHIGQDNYFEYLIMYQDQYVGAVEVHTEISNIDNATILFLDFIYVDEDFRKKGILTSTLEELKKLGYARIELECWYDLPATLAYENLGMKKLLTRYFL